MKIPKTPKPNKTPTMGGAPMWALIVVIIFLIAVSVMTLKLALTR